MQASAADPRSGQGAFASRVFVVFVLAAALLCLLLGRMAWLMVVKGDEYRTRSDENRIQTMPLPPPRGLIFDRNGELLAYNKSVFSLDIVAERVDDMDATLAEIDALVSLSEDELAAFRRQLARRSRPLERVPLKHDISDEQRARIEVNGHRLHGVHVTVKTMRFYRYSMFMAHAVGSVRRITEEDLPNLDARVYRATRFMGKRGVEAFYERSLHGEPGARRVEVDANGREREELSVRQPVAGQNLTLHLDASLQIAASAALGHRRGAVVAIDPRSGGILALVSNPGYDANLFVPGIEAARYRELTNSPDKPLINRAARGLYPPGSTFKPIVGLAGLTLGYTDWERTINDARGEFRLPGQRRAYRDWAWKKGNPVGQGIVDMQRAIYRSANVYFFELASRMPADVLPDFASQFGFGRVNAVDVEDAHPGLLPDSEWKAGAKGEPWYPGDNLNMAIGQGDMLVTPLQMAAVTAAIANRGRLVRPRMLKSSDRPLLEHADAPPPAPAGRVEGPTAEDWQRMVDAMADVVHRGNLGYGQSGTAWFHIGQDIPYRMAGKSGTVQVVGIPQGEEYDEDELDEDERKHGWFIAFAPVEKPRIALAVLVENGGGGSSVAAPVARQVVDAYLQLEPAADEQRPALAQRTADVGSGAGGSSAAAGSSAAGDASAADGAPSAGGGSTAVAAWAARSED